MKKDIEFEYADPWLLLSIIYAKIHGESTLANIIGYGDFINHAVFSLEELQGGLFRLIRSGYVIDNDKEFLPTDKISVPYEKFTKKKNPVNKELQFIRVELNAPEWSDSYDPVKANKSGSYSKINQESFESAYKEYAQKMKI